MVWLCVGLWHRVGTSTFPAYILAAMLSSLLLLFPINDMPCICRRVLLLFVPLVVLQHFGGWGHVGSWGQW